MRALLLLPSSQEESITILSSTEERDTNEMRADHPLLLYLEAKERQV